MKAPPHRETLGMPEEHVLVARNLRKQYGERWVVDGVTVRVEPGEIVGLLGPNGAGKTTTFGMIVGNVKAEGGNVIVDDTDITAMSMSERARQGLGYLSQERSMRRKVQEAMLAFSLEHKFSKDEILAQYLIPRTSATALTARTRRRSATSASTPPICR